MSSIKHAHETFTQKYREKKKLNQLVIEETETSYNLVKIVNSDYVGKKESAGETPYL